MENVGLMAALAAAMTKAPSTTQVTSAVDAWLDDHPEATTTVQDGAITKAKLNATLQETVDEVPDLKNATEQLSNMMPTSSETGAAVLHGTEEIKDVILNGASSGVYDGMIVIDGNTVKITGTNGQSGDYNNFTIYVTGKENGKSNFVADWLPTDAASGEKVTGRAANTMLEIVLLQTRCSYTVDAANAYFASHPLTVWYETTDNGSATKFYQYVTASYGTNSVYRIGTAEAITDLSAGDYIDFGAKKVVRSGVKSDVSVVNGVAGIPNNATISGGASVTVATYQDIGDELQNKVDIDGWNEVTPLNTTFFDGANYFNTETATVDTSNFVNANGTITSAPSVNSLIIPVKPNTTYRLHIPSNNRGIIVENTGSVFVTNETYTKVYADGSADSYAFTTGATARYIFVYFYSGSYDYNANKGSIRLVEGTSLPAYTKPTVKKENLPRDLVNPLDGANLLIFGDSITDTCDLTINASDETTAYTWKNPSNSYVDAGGTTVSYSMWPKMLKDLGIFTEIRNYARSGASYKNAVRAEGEERQNLSYQITVALNDLDNPNNVFAVDDFTPDIVIFALGTNDGEPNDTYSDAMAKTVLEADGYSVDTDATLASLDLSKFCEAARSAFLRTRIAFPEAQFFCVLPIQRANDETNGGNLNTYLREMARRYGCVVIDGYAESGIVRDTNVWNALGATLKDGLHPNEKGQNMMFRMIYSALKAHYIKDLVMN